MAFGGVTVSPPGRSAHRYGLFSAVSIVDVTDEHELMGVQWTPFPCDRPELWVDDCIGSPGGEGEKLFAEQPDIIQATPITVYGSFHCNLLGFSVQEAQDRAREHLAAGEQQAVEYALWTGEAGNSPYLASPDTEDLGEASCANELLAMVYRFADTAFVGEPVLHVPRAAVPWMSFSVVADSGRLRTQQGVPIAAGAGYTEANTGPDGEPAPEGSWWVYVTGPLVVRRGSVEVVPNPGSRGFSTRDNQISALAERQFVVGWDCVAGAVLFSPRCGG